MVLVSFTYVAYIFVTLKLFENGQKIPKIVDFGPYLQIPGIFRGTDIKERTPET